jgi:integrase
MRVSEALGLRLGDVTSEGLLIRKTKFQKTRLVPLHDTALVSTVSPADVFGRQNDHVA